VIPPDPLMGAGLHAVGATAAALCYTPQQRLRGWSWQTYWLSQAAICWLIAPIIGALITIPEIMRVLSEAPPQAMALTFVLGVAYGIGGTAFGMAIRHIGYSLTYAIAIGISCVMGTLTGPILKGAMAQLIDKPGSNWVFGGIAVGVLGTLMCGLAGRLKEVETSLDSDGRQPFNLGKGLTLCVIAGVFSAVYGIALNDTGKPIAEVAAAHGAGGWQTNIVYIFANTGAFLTAALYTSWRSFREGTWREFVGVKDASPWVLATNYLLAILTGLLWYSQFLFYGLGHVRMGAMKFSSWAIHMIMLILISSLTGAMMREWSGCRPRTKLANVAALVVLVGAVTMLTYGNFLADNVSCPVPKQE
jgi:L-rhamnose-H+ transport protein